MGETRWVVAAGLVTVALFLMVQNVTVSSPTHRDATTTTTTTASTTPQHAAANPSATTAPSTAPSTAPVPAIARPSLGTAPQGPAGAAGQALLQLKAQLGSRLVLMGGSSAWDDVCRGVETAPRPSKAEPRGFTLGMTTYKGNATVRNTLASWGDAGLLQHPRLAEVVIHINRCSPDDVSNIQAVMLRTPGVPYCILCSEENVLHPTVLLRLVSHVTTPYLLLTENDRPTPPRVGESPSQHRSRVQGFLDVALKALSREGVPLVFLERGPQHADDVLFRQTFEYPDRDVELDWPEGGCWRSCYLFSIHSEVQREKALSKCEDVEALSAGKGSMWHLCAWRACREWKLWHAGKGGVAFTCPPVWQRAGQLGAMKAKVVATEGTPELGGPLVCAPLQGWSNGPSMFSVDWYRDTVVGAMCADKASAKKAGLVHRASRSWFVWYGRAMEGFLSKALNRRGGTVICKGDGIMDHVEKEVYDSDKVD